MPDARTVGENGVAVYQTLNSSLGIFYRPLSDESVRLRIEPTHVAFPKDEAEALLKVARVARDPLRTDGLLTLALMDLDAARKQGGSDMPENLTPDEQQGWVDHESAS